MTEDSCSRVQSAYGPRATVLLEHLTKGHDLVLAQLRRDGASKATIDVAGWGVINAFSWFCFLFPEERKKSVLFPYEARLDRSVVLPSDSIFWFAIAGIIASEIEVTRIALATVEPDNLANVQHAISAVDTALSSLGGARDLVATIHDTVEGQGSDPTRASMGVLAYLLMLGMSLSFSEVKECASTGVAWDESLCGRFLETGDRIYEVTLRTIYGEEHWAKAKALMARAKAGAEKKARMGPE